MDNAKKQVASGADICAHSFVVGLRAAVGTVNTGGSGSHRKQQHGQQQQRQANTSYKDAPQGAVISPSDFMPQQVPTPSPHPHGKGVQEALTLLPESVAPAPLWT